MFLLTICSSFCDCFRVPLPDAIRPLICCRVGSLTFRLRGSLRFASAESYLSKTPGTILSYHSDNPQNNPQLIKLLELIELIGHWSRPRGEKKWDLGALLFQTPLQLPGHVLQTLGPLPSESVLDRNQHGSIRTYTNHRNQHRNL